MSRRPPGFPIVGYVYSVTLLSTGQCYIGCTADPEKRWRQHLLCARRGVDHPLYDAVRRYGEAQFRFEVLSRHKTTTQAFREETALLKSEAFYEPAGFNRRPNAYFSKAA